MSKSRLQEMQKLLPALSKNRQRYIYALTRAAVDSEEKNMAARNAKRFDRLFHGKHDARHFSNLVRFLISLGYLPEGFRLET
jgi:hypothetical protein